MENLVGWFLGLFDGRNRVQKTLLREIIANPADDAPRLAFADHLAKKGSPNDVVRADFIRHQIETARLSEGFEKSRRIEQAVRLFDQHKSQWYGWVRNPDNIPFPQRGFIESWYCGKDAVHQADFMDAFVREPITELTLSPGDDKLGMMSKLPSLKRVRVLKLWADQPTESDLVTFFSSPNITGLREFEYMAPGTVLGRPRPGSRVPFEKATRILAGDSRFAELRRLSIGGVRMADEGATAFAHSTVLSNLGQLGLGYCDIEAPGMRELLASPVLANVATLGLGGNASTVEAGENLAESIGSSPYLGQLSTLVLDDTALTDRAAARLARADLPALKCFLLLPRNINDSESPVTLPSISAIGLESLAESKWLVGLEQINLSGHPIGDAGARALAAARLPHLRHLTLMQVGLTSSGLKPLIEAYSNQLHNFQLYGNALGDDGANLIASATWSQMVPQPGKSNYEIGLFLGGCGFTRHGIDLLLESRTTRLIPSLFLGSS